MTSVRICAALGAALVASAAHAAEPAVNNRSFQVVMTGFAALPPAVPSVLGVPRDYREKDVLFSMPVAWQDRATIAAEAKVAVAGFDWTVKSGEVLTRVQSATGGNLDSLPAGAVTYCGEYFKKKGGIEAHLLTLGLSSVVSRLSNWLQVCLVDSDVDGAFDKGFLVGAKRPEDRLLVDVAPAAYSVRKLEPVPDSRLDVVYYDGGLFNSANFELQLFVEKARVTFGGMAFPDNEMPDEVRSNREARKKWMEEKPPELEWFFPIKSSKIPQTFTVGDSKFTVHAVDGKAKTARITIDRDTQGFPFATWQQATTIYIPVYVPN